MWPGTVLWRVWGYGQHYIHFMGTSKPQLSLVLIIQNYSTPLTGSAFSQPLMSGTTWSSGFPLAHSVQTQQGQRNRYGHAGEEGVSSFKGPDTHHYSQLTQHTDGRRGKSTCMKDNHFQSGANPLTGFVLNQECCFSFQSIVIKCAYTLQQEWRGRLMVIKSPLCLA